MPNRKASSAKTKAFLHSGSDGQRDSGLQLRREIDRLALLLEQVRKQSEKVQAAADAMGCNLVFDLESTVSSNAGQDSKQWSASSRSRRGKLVPFAPEQTNLRPF